MNRSDAKTFAHATNGIEINGGLSQTFNGLCAVGFLARASYALARTPVLALFAASFGVGPEAIGFAVAISTVTGIFFKMPAGVLSDVIGRTRTLFIGLAVFAFVPFAYLFVSSYQALVVVRFLHGFATAVYGPVVMAVIVSVAGEKRAEMLSWFSSITIIGNLLGAPLGGFLLTRLAGGQEPNLMHFHIVYGVVAALGMASLVIALWVMQGRWDSPRREHDKTLSAVWAQFRTGVRELLMDRRVLLTSNMEGIQNLSVGALEAFLYLCGVGVRILSVPGRVALGHTSCRDGSFQAAHGKNFRSAWSSESPVLGYVRMRGTLCAHPVVSEFHCAPRVGSNFRAW